MVFERDEKCREESEIWTLSYEFRKYISSSLKGALSQRLCCMVVKTAHIVDKEPLQFFT